MNNNKIFAEIKKHFSNYSKFERKELFEFLEQRKPKLTETAFKWNIRELKKNNIISSVKRGVFKITSKKNYYLPDIDDQIKSINKVIKQEFDDIRFCIWNSLWLNEFSRHQASKNLTFVEVEKDLVQSIFYLLSDKNFKNVYIEPDSKTAGTYIFENYNSIIVKSLTTKAPLQNVQKISIPKIEKLLVDLFCDKNLLIAYQGNEMISIFKIALSEYEINYSTLLHYSRRRKKEPELKDFLLKNIKVFKNYLL